MRYDWRYLRRILTGLGRTLQEFAERERADYQADVSAVERATAEVEELKRLLETYERKEEEFIAAENDYIEACSREYSGR